MKRQGYDSGDSIGNKDSIDNKDNAGNIDNIYEAELKNVREDVFLHVWLPVITEYVEWVLEEAIASGKKRLYFLARDGYMMYLMAQKLVSAGKLVRERKPEIELRYLKVSRFAVRNTEYYFIGRDALDTLCVGGIDVTFEKIMKRAGLTDEEALHIAKLAGRAETYKTALNYRQLRRLKEELSQIDELFLYIKTHSEACYETTAAYLKQEGLLDEIPYALVDSGWVGSLQLSIQRILSYESSRDVRLQGYYFGIYERAKGTYREQYKAFYFDERHVRRKVGFSNCLFETVVSAPEGMTCGYEEVMPEAEGMRCGCEAVMSEAEGMRCGCEAVMSEAEETTCEYETVKEYIAVESGMRNPNTEAMEYFAKLLSEYASVYTELIINSRAAENISVENATIENAFAGNTFTENAFAEQTFAENVSGGKCFTVSRKHKKRVRFVERLLSQMMGSPAKLEAEAFGEMLFCDDVLELQLQPVAAKWDEEELRKNSFINKLLIKLGFKPRALHESAWAEGSIIRLGIKIKKYIRQERLYKRFMYLRKAVRR